MMKRYLSLCMFFALCSVMILPGAAQEADPTPTLVPIQPECVMTGVEELNLLRNGDFQQRLDIFENETPLYWTGNGEQIVDATQQVSETVPRGLVQLKPGEYIAQVPQTERIYTRFYISLCALIVNGQITVRSGNIVLTAPDQSGFVGTRTARYESGTFPADLTASQKQNFEVIISFTATEGYEDSAIAYIDNVELLHVISGDETPEPTEMVTPSPEPTSTPEGTPAPSPTATPTLEPGAPTATPTPGVNGDSVRLLANPPMLTVGMDDFADQTQGTRKQVELDLEVIGNNGEPLDILSIDPEATVQFEIPTQGELGNVGTMNIRMDSGQSFENISTRRIDLDEIQGKPVYFFPTKPFTGTVFVVVTIEYDAEVDGNDESIELKGVVPIYMRQNPSSSMTNATGMFNPMKNYRFGRRPGDRGFRPDVRTNMMFRERISSQ